MFWLLNILFNPYPRPRYFWAKVRIIYESERAILILYENSKVWVPKSRIKKVKFKKNCFYLFLKADYMMNTDERL